MKLVACGPFLEMYSICGYLYCCCLGCHLKFPEIFRFVDEMEFHMNSEQITVSPTHGYGVQGGNQFQFSVAGTSHPMEDFSSMLCNGFATGDASAGWDGSVSMAPLGMTDSLALNENFQVDTPAWQGNSFFVTPRNQAELDLVSSNFGIRFSGIGKSKASWCKIRAVIKWRMVKSSCQKKAKKF